MENRSFEGDSPRGSSPKEPKDNLPGPSNPRANPSGESKDQAKERIPPLARTPDDDESPPAYARRYMPKEQKLDDLEDLQPPTEQVQEPRDVRLDPEFQQQASRRRARRYMQNLVEGPCSLRPDSNNRPLPVPEPYPGIGLQPAGAPNPGEQGANAPNPGEQGANAPNPGEQGANAPNPGEQGANAPNPGEQGANAPNPGEQGANAPNPGEQGANAPNPGENVAQARSAAWNICVSCYKRISTFSFQFPFHTLLLTWPLATAVMGVLNLKACLINYYLPYVMMAVGILGTAAVLFRLYVIYFEHRVTLVRAENFWIWVRCSEFVIWIFFTIQLYFFLKQAPSFNPGEEHYCISRFYKINCALMGLTFVTMIGWIIVNVGNFIYWFPRRNESSSF